VGRWLPGGLSLPAEKITVSSIDLEIPEHCHFSGDAKTMANVPRTTTFTSAQPLKVWLPLPCRRVFT
jgi:hypothetical protein